ncbi:enhancer of mRNA-decapping protein 4-like [Sinocyclocheilus grahami]|uniref:enhancer of mRNA-decapping protein 4-like n=1 Tax=Sinocyclocheilus grahami TaxID=75366 RepID=UPI0007ACD565|nr:PREDICTED: enhancer of mRNA-decapping protein 4-like [Sinocyclocheilus grahami]
MASSSNMDIEGATQHLRDILKLDRPCNSADPSLVESQRKPSFNGELNGVLGADLMGAGRLAAMVEPTNVTHNSDKLNGQDTQTICLSGDDGSTCVPIRANNVEIVSSRDSSIDSKARGSNKVKIQPVAKYDWEHKYYYGNLIAVSNSYLAYAIRGANNHSMIRVLRLGSTERSLLKGFTGAVTDLAFAHLDSTLLGCVDEAGNMFIWQLTSHSSKIQDEVLVHIRRPEDTPLNSNRRLIWCPFIPEDNDENPEDACQTLALLHEDRAEVWDLDILRSNNSSWPVDATDLKEGFITIRGHTARISEGALSPDGTVLATASHDGYVKFWQIYIEGQDQPRCLHEWQPHNGRPLSCLLFCDNHKKQDPEVPFWRFLITGADQNQELKMWCTVSWTCLQTIRFSPDLFNSSVLPSLKASLDLSAEFLILLTIHLKKSDQISGFSPPLMLSPSLLREASLLCEASPYSHRLPLPYFLSPPPQVSPPNLPLSLDLQAIEPMVVPQASPTRVRSPDVISSASTAMSQDIPEIASETLQRGLASASADSVPVLHSDSMASAASVLHLLSPRARSSAEHSLLPLELGAASVDGEQRLNNTPSLLETALSQENAVAAGGSCSDSSVNHTWPAAPDITRETRNSHRDNGLGDCSREEIKDRHISSPYHRRTYHLTQNDSQDASAEQSLIFADITDVSRLLKKTVTERRMERILAEGQSRNQQLQDQLVQQLVQTLNNSLCNRLDKILREEMKKTVPQSISKSLEPVTSQMSCTIAAKLTAVEVTLKENVTKVVKSKNTTDAIGRAAAEAMQGPIQSAYKETFQSIVLPVFERGCQSMFQQINDSFKQGTHEYIQQLETHIKNRKQRDQDAQDPVIGQLQQMIDTLQNSQDQLATTVTASVCSDVQHQLHMIVGNLQDSILTQVQRIVKGEVSLAMKEQQAAVTSSIMQAMRSAAGTPVPSAHLDYQAQQASILQLLQQGQLNEAFQLALSAADLNLVLYVCETIDSQQVFGQQPCPLHQAVLLSLIQQLSTNLSTRTELKISYLEDAVMNLDHGDPVTRDHMSAVLSQVRQKLLHFLQQDAHSPLSKRARRLMMMLQGLVNH